MGQNQWVMPGFHHFIAVARVRTIPVLGYRVLGDICMYWVVSVSGDTFFGRDTRYDTVVH